MQVFVLLAVVTVGLLTVAASAHVAASLPLWQMNVGAVGNPGNWFLLSNDAQTVYTLWSANSWAPRPTIVLLALSTSSGSLIWNASLFGVQATNQNYVFSEGSSSIYVTAIYEGKIISIDKASGGTRWLVTPFQSSGFGLSAYGAVEDPRTDSGLVYTDNSRSGVVLNASTGETIPSYVSMPFPGQVPVLWQNATGFTYVVFPGVYLNVYATSKTSPPTAAMVWNITAKNSNPFLLAADASIAVISVAAGAGVPEILVVNSNTGSPLWNRQFYNNPDSFAWAALTDSSVLALLGNTIIAFDRVTGNATWERPLVNRTNGMPILYASGSMVAVAWSDGVSQLVSSYSTANGAFAQQWTIAAVFTQWYQSAQIAISAQTGGVIIASIISNSQDGNQQYNTLVAIPLTPKPPLGVVVQKFPTSSDCNGAFRADVVPTGCTQEPDGTSVSRMCNTTSSSVMFDIYAPPSGGSCEGAPTFRQEWLIGKCYANVEGSFKVESCS